jgi:MFS family permease
MTFLTSLQPFTGDELAAVREFLAERNYDPVYFPGVTVDELNQHNVLEEPLYHDLFTEILSDPQAAYDESRFNIEPPTDDKPFFYHYFKWRQTPEILAGLGYNWQPFGGSGYFVLVALLIVVLLASAVLILSPLLLRRLLWREERLNRRADEIPRWRLRVFLYFSALGLAFLFIEIPLAQRFILLLDQPVTALAAVLFAILLFSGLGSLTVRRWSTYRALPLLIALIIFLPFLLKPLSEVALNLPQWRRIIFAVLIVAPLGFLMGFPFAGGLRVVEDRDPSLVPWAWAINGVFSVVSSVLAVMVALSWGFPAVFWLGALAYGIALLSFRRFWIGGKRTARIT